MTTTDRDNIIASARELEPQFAVGLDGPGPYQAATDRELAAAINTIYGHGFADATGGSTEHGLHGARVGRYVVWSDDRGFHYLSDYESEECAQDALDSEETREED